MKEELINRLDFAVKISKQTTKEIIDYPLIDNYKFIFDVDTDAEMFIIHFKDPDTEKDTLVLSFRGTEHIKDAINNLRFAKVRIDEINHNKWCLSRIHRGFKKQYLTLFDKFKDELLNADDVICMGHSLGGALAVLCSYDIKHNYPNVQKLACYTFGSPRVGNTSFQKEFDKLVPNCYRIVNNDDPIPLLPPKFLYTHCGNPIIFKDDKIYRKERGLFRTYLNIILRCGQQNKSWHDHKLDEYVKIIENIPNKIEKKN